jgi:hypothetical protein
MNIFLLKTPGRKYVEISHVGLLISWRRASDFHPVGYRVQSQ